MIYSDIDIVVNRKSQVADLSATVPMTLSDLERSDERSQMFQRISFIMLALHRLTWTDKIRQDSIIYYVRSGVFLGVNHAPIAKGRVPTSHKFLGSTSFDLKRPNSTRQHPGGACFRGSATTLHLHKCVARFVSDS